VRTVVALALVLAACGDNAKEPDYLGYDWDDRRVLCSAPLDDLGVTPREAADPTFIHQQIDAAARGGWALVLHAHQPTVGISLPWLDQVLTWADDAGLTYYTFDELVPGGSRGPGLALGFDDCTPDNWMEARATLMRHDARVTLFVSQWQDLTPPGLAEIAVLHEDGDAIEAHSVNHLYVAQYVEDNGIDAYIANEMLPSLEAVANAGYPYPAAFAYPFGEHTPALDRAALEHVGLVRATRGECPWSGWGL